MRLIELWTALVAKASEEEQALARNFHAHVEDLSETLAPAELPQEYPKWVLGVVVNDAEEEAKVRSSFDVGVTKLTSVPAELAPDSQPSAPQAKELPPGNAPAAEPSADASGEAAAAAPSEAAHAVEGESQ